MVYEPYRAPYAADSYPPSGYPLAGIRAPGDAHYRAKSTYSVIPYDNYTHSESAHLLPPALGGSSSRL